MFFSSVELDMFHFLVLFPHRYTDPVLGVNVLFNIIILDNLSVEVRISITDFCAGGIPGIYFDYLKRHWSSKCFDERERKEDTSSVSLSESVGDGMSEVSSHESSGGPSRAEVISASDAEVSAGSVKSSSTRDRRPEVSGFPHLVQLYSIITENGNDFDVSVRTTNSGSVFKVKFGGQLITYSINVDSSAAKDLKQIDIKGL
jgi:hypothetical protein